MMGWLAVLSCAPLIGTRARAFGVAQSGLYAVQGLGILAGGAVAQPANPGNRTGRRALAPAARSAAC